MPEQQEQYLTVREARERMGISENTIAKMIREGELSWVPNARHKGSKLIPLSAVEEWLKKPGRPIERKKAGEPVEEPESVWAAA